MKTKLKQMVSFCRGDVWTFDTYGRGYFVTLGVRLLRAVLAVCLGFKRDKCVLHASALTYYTMMALVPVLIVVLTLAKAFGAGDLARNYVESSLDQVVAYVQTATEAAPTPVEGAVVADPASQQPEPAATQTLGMQIKTLVQLGFDKLDKFDFRKLGALGAFGLFLGAIGLLRKIERSFNEIWNVPEGRSWWAMCRDYLMMLFIVPLFLMAASSLPALDMWANMATKVNASMGAWVTALLKAQWIKGAIGIPVMACLFAFLLGYMPNTRVKFSAAFIAGIITAILFAIWLKVCMMFQVGIANYSSLYGGFALLPILLLWVYASWQIVLFGAEFSLMLQAGDKWGLDVVSSMASPRTRAVVALAICKKAALASMRASPLPLCVMQFAQERKLSYRLVQSVVLRLEANGILAEIANGKAGCYLLKRSADRLKGEEIVKAVLNDGVDVKAVMQGTVELQELDQWGKSLDAAVTSAFAASVIE